MVEVAKEVEGTEGAKAAVARCGGVWCDEGGVGMA